MKPEWADRARARMRILKMRQEDLLSPLGVTTRGAVGHYFTGRRQLSAAQSVRLATALRCSVNWLMSGESTIAETPPPGYGIERGPAMPPLRVVPIVGSTQAGASQEWYELGQPAGYGDEYLDAPSKDANAYALRVRGTSMSPRMRDGEVLLVEPGTSPQPGDEVVVKLTDGTVMVKALVYQRDGEVALDSIADGHARITVAISAIETMHTVAGIFRASAVRKRVATP